MRIRRDQDICGFPAWDMRSLMREMRRASAGVRLEDILTSLRIGPAEAQALVERRGQEGYVTPTNSRSVEPHWETTPRGNQLALATAAKPIRRSTGDRLVSEFLSRVMQVRDNPTYLYKVAKATVFGSYLSDAQELGDVDIVVELVSKIAGKDERERLERAKVRDAQAKGRAFSNFVAELLWPRMEVMRFLKARSGYLSLHDPEDAVLEIVPNRRVIYDDTKPLFEDAQALGSARGTRPRDQEEPWRLVRRGPGDPKR